MRQKQAKAAQPAKPAKRALQGRVPAALYEQIVVSAAREHRTIIGQVAYILERYYASTGEGTSGHAA